MLQYCCIILFHISPQRIVLYNMLLFPTQTTSGHRVVKLQLLGSESDDEPLTHKIEVHACKMSMEHVEK